MSSLVDRTRPFWLPGLNAVSGPQREGFGKWLLRGTYSMHSPVSIDKFSLVITDSRPFLAGVAADCSRLASAAIESISEANQNARAPRATAWVLIRLYYAGYFAAHAILRTFGISIFQLESEHSEAVEEVADVWGMLCNVGIRNGTYVCRYNSEIRTVECQQARGGSGGTHEVVWAEFRRFVSNLASRVLSTSSADSIDQSVATKLGELEENLCQCGRTSGNWLSYIRNQITYRQQHGCWYPYTAGELRSEVLSLAATWRNDPMECPLIPTRSRPLKCFATTIGCLLAWQRAIIEDMSERCPKGKSFLLFGPQAYLAHFGRA